MKDQQKSGKKPGSGDQGTAEEGHDRDYGGKAMHLDVTQDSDIDPTPLTFNLDALEATGDIIGVFEGLGCQRHNRTEDTWRIPATQGTFEGGRRFTAQMFFLYEEPVLRWN